MQLSEKSCKAYKFLAEKKSANDWHNSRSGLEAATRGVVYR